MLDDGAPVPAVPVGDEPAVPVVFPLPPAPEPLPVPADPDPVGFPAPEPPDPDGTSPIEPLHPARAAIAKMPTHAQTVCNLMWLPGRWFYCPPRARLG